MSALSNGVHGKCVGRRRKDEKKWQWDNGGVGKAARVLFLVSLCFCGASSYAANITNRVQSFSLNPTLRTLDGQWQGITVASDGNCYFGSSTHSATNGGTFWKYNPVTGSLSNISLDLSVNPCNENPKVTPPQGKLHSPIVEHNGWLYFGTHLGLYTTEAEASFTGGHLIGYEMATGRLRDLGVVRPHFTIYSAVGVDTNRSKLWVFVTQFTPPGNNDVSYLYRVDINNPTIKENYGVVRNLGRDHACFYFFVDQGGDCWFTVRDNGATLMRARAGSMTIDSWPNILPESGMGPGRFMHWVAPVAGSNTCVFNLYSGSSASDWIYSFDPRVFTNGLPNTNAFRRIHNIGYTYLGLALRGDKLYYIQQANRGTRHQDVNDHHLLSVSLRSNVSPAIVDYGLIQDQDGRQGMRFTGLAADDNQVYVIGDWYTLANDPANKKSLRYYPGQGYVEVNRGQFFGVSFSRPPRLNWRYQPAQRALQYLWPTSSPTWSLQSTTNVALSSSWAAVMNPVAVSNGQNVVSINAGQDRGRFYRLRKP